MFFIELYNYKTPIEQIQYLLEKCVNSTSNHYLKPEDVKEFRDVVEDFYFNTSINSLPEDKVHEFKYGNY